MKRYEGYDMEADDNGPFVKFSDVEALVKALSNKLTEARDGNDSPMLENVQATIDSALKALGE